MIYSQAFEGYHVAEEQVRQVAYLIVVQTQFVDFNEVLEGALLDRVDLIVGHLPEINK